MDTASGKKRECYPSARARSSLLFVRLHEGQEVVRDEVCVAHRCLQVAVAHCLLNEGRGLTGCEPCGHATVSQIVLIEVLG